MVDGCEWRGGILAAFGRDAAQIMVIGQDERGRVVA